MNVYVYLLGLRHLLASLRIDQNDKAGHAYNWRTAEGGPQCVSVLCPLHLRTDG